jgi:hypothetical protein
MQCSGNKNDFKPRRLLSVGNIDDNDDDGEEEEEEEDSL